MRKKVRLIKIVWIVLLISICGYIVSQDDPIKKENTDKKGKLNINKDIAELDSISMNNKKYIHILDSINKANDN